MTEGKTSGFHVPLTNFFDVTDEMVIAQVEIIGPALCTIPLDSEQEAIAVASDNPTGLSSGVWARDRTVVSWASKACTSLLNSRRDSFDFQAMLISTVVY